MPSHPAATGCSPTKVGFALVLPRIDSPGSVAQDDWSAMRFSGVKWFANVRNKPMKTQKISPTRVLYIKLGEGGRWEKDCITKDNNLRLGYVEAPHDLCLRGGWQKVLEIYEDRRRDEGAATRDTNQIRHFYESDETVLWITFS